MPTWWCWCSTCTQDISDQDAHLAGFILEAGRALVVAVNKWDAADEESREKAKRDYERKLNFLDFAPVHYISARSGHRRRGAAQVGGCGLCRRHGQAVRRPNSRAH